MAKNNNSVAYLAKRGDMKNLDDSWITAVEKSTQDWDDLLETLSILIKDKKDDKANEFAGIWLAAEKERADSPGMLKLARELSLRCRNYTALRDELIALYEEIYADREELPALMEASGITGDKTVRRAMRTLDICLELKVGDYLISRSEEQVVKVTEIDWDLGEYTVVNASGLDDEFEPDALALKYDPIDENDFRVLQQMRLETIQELIKSDPVTLVIGILRSHQGSMDSDYLEHALSPRFIALKDWKKWWTKAKTAIKRCPNIVMEGKNPLILTYDEQGITLEDEILPLWKKADSAAQRLSAVDAYFREGLLRKCDPDTSFVALLHDELISRFKTLCNGAPVDALIEALIADRLADGAEIPGREGSAAETLIVTNPNVASLFVAPLTDVPSLYNRALLLLEKARPDEWVDLYTKLMPTAPVDGCETIAQALKANDQIDKLTAAVMEIPNDFKKNLDAICWLWRGSKALEGIEGVITPRELLPRLLNHLADLTRSDSTTTATLRDARAKLRSAIGAGRYKHYREVIESMDANMAATIRRAVERLDGLGQVVTADMLRVIQTTHPELYAKAKVDPWEDEMVLFVTQPGLDKRQEELDYLQNVKMRENAIAIGEAASHGDLSENSEYKFALEERDLLRARAAKIQNELSLASVISAHDVTTDQVNIGTRVSLKQTDGDATRQITILGPFEAVLEEDILNYKAPMSGKLKGLVIGDTVSLETDGVEYEYSVVNIENALA